ncbi:hypothetical protein QCA50_005774 [Cerrena zonata]|uniref:Uncharacterized protein n=1 Tax=Cerrena zonata TaxID=2478898 RepID=A0AAW0GBD2_9APHY
MYSTLVSLALVSSFAFRSVAADFSVATPEFTQCEPVRIAWTEGVKPIDVIVTPTDDPCNQVLADLGADHNAQSMQWTVNLAAGTQAMISLVDADGFEAWSGAITVKGGNNTSCLPQASASVSASGSSSAAVPTNGTTLVVAPTSASARTAPAVSASASSAVPVGAANAGLNPTDSGASAFHKLSAPVMVFSGFAAVLASLIL